MSSRHDFPGANAQLQIVFPDDEPYFQVLMDVAHFPDDINLRAVVDAAWNVLHTANGSPSIIPMGDAPMQELLPSATLEEVLWECIKRLDLEGNVTEDSKWESQLMYTQRLLREIKATLPKEMQKRMGTEAGDVWPD